MNLTTSSQTNKVFITKQLCSKYNLINPRDVFTAIKAMCELWEIYDRIIMLRTIKQTQNYKNSSVSITVLLMVAK